MNKELIEKLTQEDNELLDKITKLKSFLYTDAFNLLPYNHQHLMEAQVKAMETYHTILCARIYELRG